MNCHGCGEHAYTDLCEKCKEDLTKHYDSQPAWHSMYTCSRCMDLSKDGRFDLDPEDRPRFTCASCLAWGMPWTR